MRGITLIPLSIHCSFHIGDCVDPSVYATGLELGCKVFNYARDELDLALSVMDIGGGFPVGDNTESVAAFKQAASVINESAEKVFASYPDVRLIAEPGRFFAQRTTCSFAQVIGKRKVAVKNGQVRIRLRLLQKNLLIDGNECCLGLWVQLRGYIQTYTRWLHTNLAFVAHTELDVNAHNSTSNL